MRLGEEVRLIVLGWEILETQKFVDHQFLQEVIADANMFCFGGEASQLA